MSKKLDASQKPQPEIKRPPGRPATGVNNTARSVTLPLSQWDWIDAQGGSRSHILSALVAAAMDAEATQLVEQTTTRSRRRKQK